MLLAGWEVRIGKNYERGLENVARAFSSPRSQFYPIRTELKAANNIFYLFPSSCKLAYKFFYKWDATLPFNRLTRRLQYKPFAKKLTNKRANKSNAIQRKMY